MGVQAVRFVEAEIIVELGLFVPFNCRTKPLLLHCISINGTIAKAALVAVAHAGDEARSVFVPMRSNLKSLNVALPAGSVFRLSVPLNVPLPLFNETVTGTPLVAIGFPPGSSTCTTTGARITFVNTPPTGWVVNASMLALVTE